LARHVAPFVDTRRYPRALDNLEAVVDTLRTRLSTYGDINEHLGLLFPPEEQAAAQRTALGADPAVRRVLESVRSRLDEAEWEPVALDQAVRAAGADAGVKGAQLFHPVRALLIGSEKGPELGKILAAIGPAEARRRFAQALG
jgi:glutamyl/glutaminyl-tRNA synthetase